MNDDNQDPSKAGGNTEDQTKTPVGNQQSPVDDAGKSEGTKQVVSYESYEKLLSEKKKIQRQIDKLQSDSDSKKKEELETNERFKELWETSKAEKEDISKENDRLNQQWSDAVKLTAFHDALGDTRKIDSKYTGFIDTSKIIINPETGVVDSATAQKEVDRVSKEYPEIVKEMSKGTIPSEHPTSSSPMSFEKWKDLPLSEMKKNLKSVAAPIMRK